MRDEEAILMGIGAGINKYFESAQQDLTVQTTVTVAHGLGAVPKMVSAYAVCVTATAGFNVGDRIELPPTQSTGYTTGNGTSCGLSIKFDGTSLVASIAIGGVYVIRPDNYASTNIANANFKLVLKAAA